MTLDKSYQGNNGYLMGSWHTGNLWEFKETSVHYFVFYLYLDGCLNYQHIFSPSPAPFYQSLKK